MSIGKIVKSVPKCEWRPLQIEELKAKLRPSHEQERGVEGKTPTVFKNIQRRCVERTVVRVSGCRYEEPLG